MKISNDFITNSSSSSFIVFKKDLTEQQINWIFNPQKKAEELDLCEFDDPKSWSIEEVDDKIIGATIMDNFDWIKFLKEIGVDMEKVKYDNSGSGMWGLKFLYDEAGFDPFDWF